MLKHSETTSKAEDGSWSRILGYIMQLSEHLTILQMLIMIYILLSLRTKKSWDPHITPSCHAACVKQCPDSQAVFTVIQKSRPMRPVWFNSQHLSELVSWSRKRVGSQTPKSYFGSCHFGSKSLMMSIYKNPSQPPPKQWLPLDYFPIHMSSCPLYFDIFPT